MLGCTAKDLGIGLDHLLTKYWENLNREVYFFLCACYRYRLSEFPFATGHLLLLQLQQCCIVYSHDITFR